MPRILMTMAQDGLMFSMFSIIHSRFKTPLLATLFSGLLAGKYINTIAQFMIEMCIIHPVRLVNIHLQVLSRRFWTLINLWIWCQSARYWRTRLYVFACWCYGTGTIKTATSYWKIRPSMNQRPVVVSSRWRKSTLTCPTSITPTKRLSVWPRL